MMSKEEIPGVEVIPVRAVPAWVSTAISRHQTGLTLIFAGVQAIAHAHGGRGRARCFG